MTPNSTCPHCESKLTTQQLSFDLHGYCENCHEFIGVIRTAENCCSNPDTHFVRHENKDGRFQLRKQCNNCHSIPIRSYPQKGILINNLPISNVFNEGTVNIIRKQELQEVHKEFRTKFSNNKSIKADLLDSGINYNEYVEYLRSAQWREKRLKVLDRDNNTCQSCLKAKAQEVHHITYKHLKNEPLFELVSVCKPCHDEITRMDNGSDYYFVQNKLYENLLTSNN